MLDPAAFRDAVVIGGGFYGAVIALYLAEVRGFRRVLLVEREKGLLRRASYNNQARLHNGYHYPRAFKTAWRSHVNLPRFVRDWPDAVTRDFTKLYAIAARDSKVTPRQFERVCADIGIGTKAVPPALAKLFDPRLIAAVYVTEEYAFDATRLADWAGKALARAGVEVRLGACATGLERATATTQRVFLAPADAPGNPAETLETPFVFTCAYSGLNQLQGDGAGARTPLKHEITEMALVEPPESLKGLGITVMDGPFFSLMPFPPRGLHTLSHVRYTPHRHWLDAPGEDPAAVLAGYGKPSRFERMRRDAARYLPAVMDVRYRESLFEVKTVLMRNEDDDGRPILFERHADFPGTFLVLGGKIDNIYDILERLDAEPLQPGHVTEDSFRAA